MLIFAATLLGACKFTVIPGQGGTVSIDGFPDEVCESQESCEMDTEEGLYETFVANPDEGFVFDRWTGFVPCKDDTTGRCEVNLDPAPEEYAEILSAVEITLEAHFKRADQNTNGNGNAGVFVTEIRGSGFSAEYHADENGEFRPYVDTLITGIEELLAENKDFIDWPSDLPVVFTGCATENAFFAGATPSIIDALQESTQLPRNQIATAFGDDIAGPIIVLCNELSEDIVKKVLTEDVLQDIANTFEPEDDNELIEYIDLTASTLTLQIMLHEIGHAADSLLLDDESGTVKQRNFTFPGQTSCQQEVCPTTSEDFADWFSALVLIQDMKEEFEAQEESAEENANAWYLAAKHWQTVFPDAPGDSGGVHALTNTRVANFLCYAYGGLSQFREADVDNELSGIISQAGIDVSSCESVFEANSAAMDKLFP